MSARAAQLNMHQINNSPPEIKLRDYQIDVIGRVWEQIERGRRRVCLVAPTGAGKTVIAGRLIQQARNADSGVLGALALTREIVTQTSQKLHGFGIPHGIIGRGTDAGPLQQRASRQRATFHERVMRSRRMEKPARDLIIVDECHHIWRGRGEITRSHTPTRGDRATRRPAVAMAVALATPST